MAEESDSESTPDVVRMAHALYRASRDHTSTWREEAREAYDMVAGNQWSDTDKSVLQEQNRPAVTFNRIMRTINAIIGTQVSNRQETRFIPREMGDVQINEVLTAAAEWVRDETDAEDEESDAFEDMCVSGMGWTETRMDFERDQEGEVRIDRVDPLEMYWDPGATKKNLSDVRWVMRVRKMELSEFKEKWPDADTQLATSPWEDMEDETSQRTHVYPQDAYKHQQAMHGGPPGRPTVRVAQIQWAESVEAYRVGKRAEKLTGEGFKRLEPKLKKAGIKSLRQPQLVWKQAFVAGGEVLEQDDCPFPSGSTIRCMTYKRDRNKNTWFGVVRAMRDPQKWGNKFFSQILDIINKSAKGGVMIEQDAVDDIREFEQTWARPDAVHKLRPGAIAGNKIKQKDPAPYPSGLDRLLSFSMESVEQITGVNLELLGMANRNQPGVLEAQRKQAGLTILAPLFDSLRRYRKEQGRVLLHFIREYISDDRLIRIMGQNGTEQYVPLAKQPEAARYDVIVDEAPTSPNMKERVYGALVEMLPALAKLGAPLPPELLDYAPIPSGLAQKWKELIQKSSGDPEQTAEMIEAGKKEIERLTNENRVLKDKREETAAQLQLKAQEVSASLQLKAQEAELEQRLAEAEHAAKMRALEREYALKEAEIQHKLRLAEIELGVKIQIDKQNAEADALRADSKARAETQSQRAD